jgi:hypothetical protein
MILGARELHSMTAVALGSIGLMPAMAAGAIFDEIEDFEANIRNVSGPGALAGGGLDPAHGLLIGDNGDPAVPPSAVSFGTIPDMHYTVGATSDFVPAGWTPSVPLVGTGRRLQHRVPFNMPGLFFRARETP